MTAPHPGATLSAQKIDHEFKSHPDVFWPAARGEKTFEFRKDDRGGYHVGQTVRLRCYDPDHGYYGHPPLDRWITNILRGGEFGLQEGYCILSLAPLAAAPTTTAGDGGENAEDQINLATLTLALDVWGERWVENEADNLLAVCRSFAAQAQTVQAPAGEELPERLVESLRELMSGYYSLETLASEGGAAVPDDAPAVVTVGPRNHEIALYGDFRKLASALALLPPPKPEIGWECSIRVDSDPNGKRWRLVGANFEMQPVGEICAAEAEALCRQIVSALATTPTDAQPKAAGPVGHEARWGVEDTGDNLWVGPMRRDGIKVDHIVYGQDLRGYRAEYAARVRAEARLIVDSVNAALASHPTTGQENAATPRDGGGRMALAVLDRLDDEAIAGGGRHRVSVPLLSWSEVDDLRAALSAPGSAGTGEAQVKLWLSKVAIAGFNEGMAAESGDAQAEEAATRALIQEAVAALATQSPAQEPGTGDTGEREPLIRIDPQARAGKEPCGECHLPVGETCDICGARHPTPATTAETRGPAEGAR